MKKDMTTMVTATTTTKVAKPGDFVLPQKRADRNDTTEKREQKLKKKLEKTLTPTMKLEISGKCLLNPKLCVDDKFIVYENELLIAITEDDKNIIIAKIIEPLSDKDFKALNNNLADGLAKLRDENKIQTGQKLPICSITAKTPFYHDLGFVKSDGKVITLQVAA